ncbi:sugar transferase [Namhaeicola litoreus]|uniref:Sugar transferase n=1 Tax=Namhaeicola litoreus TaxID=1052145 RepID=A0ABW3Y7N2_9FLAO
MESKFTFYNDLLSLDKTNSTYSKSYLKKRDLLTVKYKLNGNELLSKPNNFLRDTPTYLFIPNARKKFLVDKNTYTLHFKRAFDIFFSLGVFLFVLSWLYPIMYILIKLESPGPVFFKQQRTGLNGTPFECYKFRSMRLNTHSDSMATCKNDHRVTKIGKFIRKNSIDEIPQFINVLFGDMSVVGPRPHMLKETSAFVQTIPEFSIREQVKPGITGLAQVNGYRGKIDQISDLKNRLRYDFVYIERASLTFDVKIIYNTFLKMIFGDDKAY